MRMPDNMSEYMSQNVTWWGSLEESNLFRRLSKIDLRQPKLCLVGPARIIAIINNGNDIKHLILIFCFIFFGVFDVVTHFAQIGFYKLTTLCTETFTHSNFYAQTFLHREICAQKKVHRCLCKQRFLRTEKCIYTHMLCTKMFFRAYIKAHMRFYTHNLFHREAFAQNNFLHMFF